MQKNILLIPDSYKDCLSAEKVANALEKGCKLFNENFNFFSHPLSDGGEGATIFLQNNIAHNTINTTSINAIGEKILTNYLDLHNKSAFIELAATSGIQAIPISLRTPLYTNTFGTGLVIKHAIENGFKEIFLSLGGSATNDGGAGILQALGFIFKDENDCIIEHVNGSTLRNIKTIVPPKYIEKVKFTFAADVQNILLGENGATYTYATQKGAKPSELDSLEKGMRHFANVLMNLTKKDLTKETSSGAAGGAAFGLMHFYEYNVTSGFEILCERSGLEEKIKTADLIITGEGKTDKQTLNGKLVFKACELAKRHNKPIFIFSGRLEGHVDLRKALDYSYIYTHEVSPKNLSFDQIKEISEELITRKCYEEIKTYFSLQKSTCD